MIPIRMPSPTEYATKHAKYALSKTEGLYFFNLRIETFEDFLIKSLRDAIRQFVIFVYYIRVEENPGYCVIDKVLNGRVKSKY